MATNAPIVDAVVGIRGDTTQLTADINAAKSKVEAAGTTGADAAMKATAATNQQAAATSALGEELRKVKKTYGEQIEVVQGLIGKLFAIGATVAIAYKVGQAIRDYIITALSSATEKATAFRETLNFSDVAGSLKQTQQEIAELESRLAGSMESTFGFLLNLATGDTISSLKAQIEELRNTEKNLRGADEAKKRRDEEDKAATERDSLAKSAFRDAMTEEERIRADANDRIAELQAAHDAMNANRQKELAASTAAAIAAIRAKADAQIQGVRDAEAKRNEQEADDLRKRAEDQAKAAKQVQKSWSDAYRAIREESNRAFATDQAASMVQFAAQMRIEGAVATANMNQIVVQGVG